MPSRLFNMKKSQHFHVEPTSFVKLYFQCSHWIRGNNIVLSKATIKLWINPRWKVIKICSKKFIWAIHSHRPGMNFEMVECQLYHICNVIHQSYISPIHQSINSRLYSKFKVTCTVKLDNKTRDQLAYTCNISAKPLNYMRNW